MSDRYNSLFNKVSNNATAISQHQPIQYHSHQYSEPSTKTFLTNDELDYLENVITKNYPIVPNKGFLSYNSYANNANNNCNVSNIPRSEPNFKGQLSKYFPESIRSNFNDAVDFNELKPSELFVSDNSFHSKLFFFSQKSS